MNIANSAMSVQAIIVDIFLKPSKRMCFAIFLMDMTKPLKLSRLTQHTLL